LRAVDDLLEPAVAEQVKALQCSPDDAGVVALALTLARTIDGMDDDTRGRMLAQTSGALLRALEVLEARVRARPVPAPRNRLHALHEARESRFPQPGSAMLASMRTAIRAGLRRR
jgi:hypothetical protein